MTTGFSGTNTERIDQLITAFVELRTEFRTTLRLGFGFLALFVGLGLPLLIGLQVFLVTKAFDHTARLERIEERLGRLEKLSVPAAQPKP